VADALPAPWRRLSPEREQALRVGLYAGSTGPMYERVERDEDTGRRVAVLRVGAP